MHKAVSYTHLDVYKRQVQNLEVHAIDRSGCLIPNQHIIGTLHEMAAAVYPQDYHDN